MVAVYVSPNISRTEYTSFLDRLAACARRLGACPSLVLGDFNAHLTAWGCRRTNGRGRDVQDCAAALDLRLMNRGSTSTCVAWRGESIMDLTWANPAASRRVSGWGMSPEETLSDHLYISMEVAIGGAMSAGPPAHRPTGKENVCTRPTAKRGGPCNKPSRKRRDGLGTSQKASLDSDPCGRPYKMVLNKLRPWAPPATESMDPRFLEEVVGTLFPGMANEEDVRFIDEEEQEPQPPEEEPHDTAGSWSPESRATEEELAEAVGRIGARKAPGPDGVPARLWKDVAGVLAPRLMRLFDRCLSRGEFPVLWKEGRSPDLPSAFRPVCLLDEASKLLERMATAHLESHLSRSDPGLHDSQFGFRRGRSTADAVARVRSLVEGAERRSCVALAVSLVNAFNSIPWDRICRALKFHRVPEYLGGCGPGVYTVSGGGMTERAVYRRVPQGSVLGPLLWNIAYDAVLRASMPPDSALAYYADDTLVLVWGTAWSRTVRLAELAVACVVAAIKGLGLRVSPEKSEAMWFCRRADHGTPPAGCRLRLEGAEIEVGTSMKYLGLTLDSHWTFGAHFERLAPSVEATVNA